MQRLLVVIGTRPEVIKMAPVVLAARADPSFEVCLLSTGQHREMVADALSIFGLVPEINLEIMQPNQTLGGVTIKALSGVERVLAQQKFDWVLVQGDTTTAFAAALAAAYAKVPVAHVEAGLRTGDRMRPWPEETNRRLIAVTADLHFAPTTGAASNLLREATAPETVLVTGNTVIDALRLTAARLDADPALAARVGVPIAGLDPAKRILLVTGHRRESFGDGFANICTALARLSERSDLEIVYPVHLNPNVRGPVHATLAGRSNIHLIEPQNYLAFVNLMRRAHIMLTDSGGVQEEAPALGKPVLVMRDTSERPEAIEVGSSRLVGTDPQLIVASVHQLLDEPQHYQSMAHARNPFGDGFAAQKIVAALKPRA
jgi:UDP-N-acetylglucosamine 2-epimerase (non-hydrolysing)